MAENVQVICNMVRGAIPAQEQTLLEAKLKDVYQSLVDASAKISFVWVLIPEGQAYQARRPSATSTLLVPVPDGFEQSKRVAMMEAVRDLWMETTRCTANQVVISIVDRVWYQAYVKLSRNRIAPAKKLPVSLKMMWRMFVSKLRTGRLSMSTNLDGS